MLTFDETYDVTLSGLERPGHWANAARCRTVPANVFFPARGDSVEQARQICLRCPVLQECRKYALAAPTTLQGVWGGLSARERRDIRQQMAHLAVGDVL